MVNKQEELSDQVETKIDQATLNLVGTILLWILAIVFVVYGFIYLEKKPEISIFLMVYSGVLLWISFH